MADTRQSLFGPSPEEAAMMQRQQEQAEAMKWGQMSPEGAIMTAAAGAGQAFGRAGGTLMGGRDPMQAKAQMLQAAQQETEAQAQQMGIDLASSPKDYYKVAAQTLQKYGLVDEAQNVMGIAQNHDLAEREMRVKERPAAGTTDRYSMAGGILLDKQTGRYQPIPDWQSKGVEKDSDVAILTQDFNEGKITKEVYESKLAKLTALPVGDTTTFIERGNDSWATNFAKDQSIKASAEYDLANNAQFAIQAPQDILALLEDPKIFTGPGADVNFAVGKLLNVAGANNEEIIANTQSLYSTMAKGTLDAIPSSNLGGGQGFTESDKQFLRDASTGRISHTRYNIARLAALQMRVQANAVTKWNSRLGRMDAKGKELLQSIGADPNPIPVPQIPDIEKYKSNSGKSEKSKKATGIPSGWSEEEFNALSPKDQAALKRIRK